MSFIKKYKEDYKVERILKGQTKPETIERLKFAAFDEKLSVVGLLNGKLGEMFKSCWETDAYVTELFACLKQFKAIGSMGQVLENARAVLERKRKQNNLEHRKNIFEKMLFISWKLIRK